MDSGATVFTLNSTELKVVELGTKNHFYTYYEMNDSYELWKQCSLIPEWMTQVIFL